MHFDLAQSIRGLPGLTSGARNVLHCLAGYADNITRLCWPSIATISRGCGLSERQVQRHIRVLHAGGHIGIIEPGNGRGHVTKYVVMPQERVTSATPIKQERVTSETEKGCHGCREKGDVDVTRTIMELSSELPLEVSGDSGSEFSAEFLEFWNIYPKHKSKGSAWKAWKKLRPPPSLQLVRAAIEAQLQTPQWKKDGGQYIPYPATWLNDRAWEDETTAKQPPTSTTVKPRHLRYFS